ncbi:glycosyltransferase family 25 protein [Rhizobium sp. BK376]|uniref:glycosyltransferase family 25 protein n=1 Tax=Rhizobium sp. BK376 TaxID=2512149 RepID=UPI0010515666|nr:glycosyltransferase family 25 protein [Rhizobium sp. BK376]TCR76723.1 glycosyl transferase family 25 [Rhizobium sp. BK376]
MNIEASYPGNGLGLPRGRNCATPGVAIPVYLINLDRAPDRLQTMDRQLHAAGIMYERVIAVEGDELIFPHALYDEKGFRWRHGKLTNPAEVGCYLSHIDCARRLLASNNDHALVLEDDLLLPGDLAAIISASIAEGDLWDILRLSTVNRGRKFIAKQLTPQRALAVSLTREKGSGAYLINRRAATWLCRTLVPMCLPYDIAFDLEYLDGLRGMFVYPVPVSQEAGFPSTIQLGRCRFRLAWWQRITVYPYRAWLESSRLVLRLMLLAKFRLFHRHKVGRPLTRDVRTCG